MNKKGKVEKNKVKNQLKTMLKYANIGSFLSKYVTEPRYFEQFQNKFPEGIKHRFRKDTGRSQAKGVVEQAIYTRERIKSDYN